MPAGQRLGRVAEQHDLVAGVQRLPGHLVHHDHVVVQREHDPRGVPAGAQVLLHQLELGRAAGGQQGLGDLVRGGLGQRDQQRVGVLAPAGQVDRAHRLAGDRVVDRHPGAGQVLQVLGVMLVPEHVGRLAALQRRADAVGADELLGVAEPGRQHHAVQVPVQVRIRGHPAEHDAVGVGQDHADRLALEVLPQVPQDGHGAAGQRGVQVGVAGVGQIDMVRGHVPPPGAPPRGQDRVPHLIGLDAFGRQELLTNPGQPGTLGQLPLRGRCWRHWTPPLLLVDPAESQPRPARETLWSVYPP